MSGALQPFALLAFAAVVLTGCAPEQVAPPKPQSVAIAYDSHPSGPLLPARHVVQEPSSIIPVDFSNSPLVEVFGNYHAAGIVVELPDTMPAGEVGKMQAYINNHGAWARVQDPVQVGSFPWFATSLFWLKPASVYQVKVDVLNQDGSIKVTLFGEGATRVEPVIEETTVQYYVATNGNDGAPGTLDNPFRTIGHACGVVNAGETIFVRGGTYYEGELTIGDGLLPLAPVVMSAYPGEQPVLSAADPEAMAPSAWRDEGDGILSYPTDAAYANMCVEDIATERMVRIFPLPTLADLRARRVPDIPDAPGGTFDESGVEGGSYFDGQRVYLAPPPGLTHYRIHLARLSIGLHVEECAQVQIDGLEFRFFGRNQPNTGIFVSNAADVLIQRCRFLYDDCQIYVKGTTDRLTVQDCTFIDGILDWPFGFMKLGGAAAPYEGGCVNVDSKYSGRGLVFRRNHIAGVFDGMHLTPWLHDEARTQETDFYQNTIDGCVDDFMELDGYSRNVRIFDNYMSRSLSGISLAQALDGPTYILYNVLANCGMVAAASREGYVGYPFKTNGGPQMDVGSGPIYFYHNTAYTLDPESRAMLTKVATWRLITLRNNIWCGQRVGAEFWRNNWSPLDFDFDDLYVADPNGPLALVEYRDRVNDLAGVRTRFHWLKNGISAEPRLMDPAVGDYTLQTNSPCIDAGTGLPGVNEGRMAGAAPDLGAYELW